MPDSQQGLQPHQMVAVFAHDIVIPHARQKVVRARERESAQRKRNADIAVSEAFMTISRMIELMPKRLGEM